MVPGQYVLFLGIIIYQFIVTIIITCQHYIVLVVSRNWFEHEVALELKYIEGLMVGWYLLQIVSLFKYRQNQNHVFAVSEPENTLKPIAILC